MHLSSIAQRSRARIPLAGLGLAWLGLALACKGSIVAPAQSLIVLRSANDIISLNGSTTITAFVGDASGNPVQDGTVLNFQTTLGTVQPSQTRTNKGQATTTLGNARQAGTAAVTASSGDIASQPITVTVINPIGVAITPSPTSAAVNTVVTFTATVTPAADRPAIDHFTWDFGDSTTATTSTGTTSHVYATTGTMVVRVTASVVDGSTSVGQIEIIISSS
jgi:PKD repeat protein